MPQLESLHAVHYLPIGTTVLSAIFLAVLIRRFQFKGKGTHLLWWAGGVFAYGLGTGLESAITLMGNSIFLNKAWYIAGALLGGYPLAQGSVYLHLKRKAANMMTAITVPIIILVSVLVILSPVNLEAVESHKPSGAILVWSKVRLMTPFINIYAAIFLIGGAFLSAYRFAKNQATGNRAIGNTFIAIGAILPGIGGGMAKAGIVEALYVGEFVGLILIWIGYAYCVKKSLAQTVADSAPAALVTS